MAIIRSKAGGSVSIGDTRGGYPTRTTWDEDITVIDPGIPLSHYSPAPVDPLKIWKTQPSVRKVVEFAASHFAAIPWHAYRRGGKLGRERLSDSEVENIFTQPLYDNGMYSGYKFWNTMITDLMLYDVCLAILSERDGLVRIPPSLIEVQSDHFGIPRRLLLIGPDDKKVDVTGVPMIYADGWHATKAGGVSPMFTLSEILEENARAVKWRRSLWENSPKMSGLLIRPETARAWKPEHRERFEKQWSEWKSNPKAGGTPILEGGMEYRQLSGMSPKDANDIEGRRLTDVEVASAYHIPPELVGAREGTYSNIDAFRQMLYGPTLGPLFTQLGHAVKAGGIVQALDTREGVYVEPNREAGMAGSFYEQIKYLSTATGGPIVTQAEGRDRLNLPYLEGTDELIRPLNTVIGGGPQASPQDSGEQNVGGDNADPEARDDQ